MKAPSHLQYTDDQEWLWPQGETALVGITDDLQRQLGKISALTAASGDIRCGDRLATLQSVDGPHDLAAPISGRIVEINPLLADDPSAINRDPYGDGWIIRLRMEAGEEIEHLRDAATYQKMSETVGEPTDSP